MCRLASSLCGIRLLKGECAISILHATLLLWRWKSTRDGETVHFQVHCVGDYRHLSKSVTPRPRSVSFCFETRTEFGTLSWCTHFHSVSSKAFVSIVHVFTHEHRSFLIVCMIFEGHISYFANLVLTPEWLTPTLQLEIQELLSDFRPAIQYFWLAFLNPGYGISIQRAHIRTAIYRAYWGAIANSISNLFWALFFEVPTPQNVTLPLWLTEPLFKPFENSNLALP